MVISSRRPQAWLRADNRVMIKGRMVQSRVPGTEMNGDGDAEQRCADCASGAKHCQKAGPQKAHMPWNSTISVTTSIFSRLLPCLSPSFGQLNGPDIKYKKYYLSQAKQTIRATHGFVVSAPYENAVSSSHCNMSHASTGSKTPEMSYVFHTAALHNSAIKYITINEIRLFTSQKCA